MIVEPRAGDRVEDNLNPVGRAYYGVLDAALHPRVALAGGRAGARRAGRRGAHPRRRRRRPASRASAAWPRRRSTSSSRRGRDARGAPASRCPPRAPAREQSRAPVPRRDGHVERDGVRVSYEVYGRARPDRAPAADLVDRPLAACGRRRSRTSPATAASSRSTAAGNGRSDRPAGAAAYTDAEYAADALAVLDATGVERGDRWSALSRRRRGAAAARRRPPRARRSASSPIAPLRSRLARPGGRDHAFDDEPADGDEGWAKYNRHYWPAATTPASSSSSSRRTFTEPHSTKQIEDGVGWGLETDARDARRHGTRGAELPHGERARGDARAQVRCPVARRPRRRRPHPARTRTARGSPQPTRRRAASLLEGAGHVPHARDPVRVNLLIRDFAGRLPPPAAARSRGARRAGAGARSTSPRRSASATPGATSRSRTSCARCDPDLEIDWLAQHPVTAVLAARGERIHPASADLASESAHIEPRPASTTCTPSRRSGGWTRSCVAQLHGLPRRRARRAATTSGSATRRGSVDYFLHENPELKTAAVRLADRLRRLAADARRAATREARADRRLQRRDDRAASRASRACATARSSSATRATSCAAGFGPGLPRDPRLDRRRTSTSPATSRASTPPRSPTASGCGASSATRPDEQVCLVTVGGSGVGGAAAAPGLARVPAATAAACPACAWSSSPGRGSTRRRSRAPDGVEVRGYVHDLLPAPRGLRPRGRPGRADDHDGAHRAAAGRSSTSRCAHHFEQNIHVRAPPRPPRRRPADGLRDAAAPTAIAAAIAEEIGREVDYRPVAADGARRAAALLAELL